MPINHQQPTARYCCAYLDVSTGGASEPQQRLKFHREPQRQGALRGV